MTISMTPTGKRKKTTNAKDILFVVKNNGENVELQYALRSLQFYGDGYWRVFLVIDECPIWINTQKVNVFIRPIQYYKERDIMDSIHWVCKNTDISQDFIFYNDDFYLNAHVDFTNYPNYTRPYNLQHYVWADSRVHLRWRRYTRIIERTYQALVSKGLPILTYDLHVPMVFNKTQFPQVMDTYDWEDPQGLGMTFRSLYGNTLGLEPTAMDDVKLDKIVTYTGMVNWLSKQRFVSTGENTRASQMVFQYLAKKFPDKSIWEN